MNHDSEAAQDAVCVRNTPDPYYMHEMYAAAAQRRTGRPIGTRTTPPAHTVLAERRAELYAYRRAEMTNAYWEGMRQEIRNDTMGDIADDIRREFAIELNWGK